MLYTNCDHFLTKAIIRQIMQSHCLYLPCSHFPLHSITCIKIQKLRPNVILFKEFSTDKLLFLQINCFFYLVVLLAFPKCNLLIIVLFVSQSFFWRFLLGFFSLLVGDFVVSVFNKSIHPIQGILQLWCTARIWIHMVKDF